MAGPSVRSGTSSLRSRVPCRTTPGRSSSSSSCCSSSMNCSCNRKTSTTTSCSSATARRGNWPVCIRAAAGRGMHGHSKPTRPFRLPRSRNSPLRTRWRMTNRSSSTASCSRRLSRWTRLRGWTPPGLRRCTRKSGACAGRTEYAAHFACRAAGYAARRSVSACWGRWHAAACWRNSITCPPYPAEVMSAAGYRPGSIATRRDWPAWSGNSARGRRRKRPGGRRRPNRLPSRSASCATTAIS